MTQTGTQLKSRMLIQCLEQFELCNGPIITTNSSIQGYDFDSTIFTTRKIPCLLEILDFETKTVTHGLGCYYGYGHVLTALHVIKDAANSEILCIFSTEHNELIYKACFTKSCNTDPERDQAFIKLLGNTTPLGHGLHDEIGHINTNENVHFYTKTPDGNFQKLEGKIVHPNTSLQAQMCSDEFVMSVAGKPGDSGSPVYNAKDELIGIYQGLFTCDGRPGYGSKVSPQFLPWI